ncbi:MAG: glycerophosphodiester phosphodiesterase family protein [Bacteroidales bacterium]
MKRSISQMKRLVVGSFVALAVSMSLSSCKKDTSNVTNEEVAKKVKIDHLSPEMETVRDLVDKNIVIAHRGSTFWVPEETEAAFRWARNIGADYLEIDLQRTKEVKDKNGNVVEPSVLLALHDNNLKRTTDIEVKFPGREEEPVSSFTWSELSTLDAGSWFNYANPENQRGSFVNQRISTLEDVIMIAKGYKIKRYLNDDPKGNYKAGDRIMSIITDTDGVKRYKFEYELDPQDNQNRPGVYVETKEPWLFPNMERDLCKELKRLGWYADDFNDLENVLTFKGKVEIANTNARIILQTFSKNSLVNLQKEFKNPIPTCLLLWKGPSDMPNDDPQTYAEWINYGIKYGATIIGPSIGGAPNNYYDLLQPWMADMVREAGMLVHAYSFDTRIQMDKYTGKYYLNRPSLTDGMFTNKAGTTLDYFAAEGARPNGASANAEVVLNNLGY